MNVLLANYSLQNVGGTEKWTFAVAEEMKRRGHSVDVFTLAKGMTSDHLEEDLGVEVMVRVPLDRTYDLQMINHNACLKLLSGVSGFKLCTSHGPQHQLEEPIAGAHQYVGVSAEVRARYAPFNMTVIENGINLGEFYPQETVTKRPVVFCAAKAGKASDMVKEAVERAGMVFMSVHYTDKPIWNIAHVMRAADIVVGSGRTAYEALACGKSVLQFDWRDPRGGPLADGWVTRENVDYLRLFNIAGRGYALNWTVDDLTNALAGWVPETWGRAWAEEHVDIKQKVSMYLKLQEEYCGKKAA